MLHTNRRTPRPTLPVFLMAGSAALLVASTTAFAGKTAGQTKPKTSAQQYKNIKVLKDLPADQLIPVMRKINASLGVKCDFCHVIKPDHTGFELDDKAMKETARKMIVMTQKLYKSEKILKGKPTCFMCHHGKPEPETNAPEPPAPGR